ncbi:prepilin peptidase [Zavarzinia sp. CC-PAN008]|uniref:prepilin peptidase n=1 Tax=Zavarzinia sp. CC-PAN008 TaxID=3243332 RepID=UPI003F74620D
MISSPLAWLLLLAAPLVGSFIGAYASRWPRLGDFASGRSRCDSCATPLAARDLVPILSFAALRGRCRTCGAAIDPIQPIAEIAATGIAALVVLALPPGPDWIAGAGVVLGWALLAGALVDARHRMLPDWATLGPLLGGLAFWTVQLGAVPGPAVIGVLVAYGGATALRLLFRRLRGVDGLGEGDARLLAAAGAWVGWQGLPSVLLLAAATALAVILCAMAVTPRGDKGMPGPATARWAFGPYLGAAILVVWLFGPLSP